MVPIRRAARWTIDGEVAGQEGNHHPTMIPMGCLATADGHDNIAGASSRLCPRLCAALGRPELADDPRLVGAQARREYFRLERTPDISGANDRPQAGLSRQQSHAL